MSGDIGGRGDGGELWTTGGVKHIKNGERGGKGVGVGGERTCDEINDEDEDAC